MTLLTEKEAATKWCPLDKGSYSDRHIGGPQPFCIGSACMAWRWTRAGMVYEHDERLGSIFRTQKIGDPDYGFCGAFGKVEP